MVANDSWDNIIKNKVVQNATSRGNTTEKQEINFYQFNKPKHKFRLVGELVAFNSVYVGKKQYVITDEQVGEFEKLGLKPSLKFACNAFDRTDKEKPADKVYVIEKGLGIFKSIIAHYEDSNIHPGKKDGSEWSVTVKGSGREVKYESVIPVRQSPFTEEERAFIVDKKLYDLKTRYNADNYAKAVAKLLDDLRSGSVSVPADDSDKPKLPAKKEVLAASDEADDVDDLFGSETPAETEGETSGDGTEVDLDDLF